MADKYEKEFLSSINYSRDTSVEILKKYMNRYYDYGINTERSLVAHAIKEYLYGTPIEEDEDFY